MMWTVSSLDRTKERRISNMQVSLRIGIMHQTPKLLFHLLIEENRSIPSRVEESVSLSILLA